MIDSRRCAPWVRLAAIVLCFELFQAASLAAQKKGRITPTATGPAVAVTPDDADLGVTPNTSGNIAGFLVKNLSTSTLTFSLSCSATGGVTCTGTDVPQVTVTAGGTVDAAAFFNVGITTGRVVLRAFNTQSDSGWYNVIPQARTKPMVALRNRPDQLDRSLCLTAGAGEAAAAQCGDLLVTHGMPGYTTMGKERSLTLIYNSATAFPRPMVVGAITEGAGIIPPTSVLVELWVAGVMRASQTFSGWGTNKPVTRQIAVSYDAVAASHATGAYPFQLRVRNQYSNPSAAFEDTLNGTLIVVNRRATQLGAGVGLAGVERIHFNQPVGTPDGAILWVGGDGSARLYAKLNATTWVAPAAGFRDTLRLTSGEYTRTLRHGLTVAFDTLGRHARTTNRLNQVTTFSWKTTTDTLLSIRVPPAAPANLSYTLAYAANKLDRITDPSGRILDVTVSGGVLTQLSDPDGVATGFAYDGSSRMTSRTNRRRFVTRYEYANGLRLTKVTVPIGKTTADNATAVTTFLPWDEQGLVGVATIGVDTAKVHAAVYGPRLPAVPDTAAFWVDRWGAPTRIVNAIGAVTTLARSDPKVPALVTKVVWPNLRLDSMSYDGRGNLLQVRDSTRHLDGIATRVTKYTYKSANAPDSPDTLVDALGRKTKYSYNAQGLTTLMTDPRAHQTSFSYHGLASGPDSLRGTIQSITEMQVQTWQEPGTGAADTIDALVNQVTSFTYDAKGNLRSAKSPAGLVTAYARDVAGRVSSAYDPVGTRQEWVYDSMNRPRLTRQYSTKQTPPAGTPAALAACVANQVSCADSTPASFLPALAATLTTTYTYDSLAVVRVVDPRGVARSYQRDARGLIWQETDDFGRSRTATYDVAGLLLESVSRSGAHITFTYDTLGRRTSMTYPAVTTAGRLRSQTMPGDVIRYTYDIMGNQLTSAGQTGTITRQYWADGALKEKLTDLVGGFGDTLSYSYDLAGALTQLIHGADRTDYGYNGTTGDLDTLVVRWGIPLNRIEKFAFHWDGLGRRRQITYPTDTAGLKNLEVKYRYDMAGTLRRVVSRNSWTTSRNAFDFTFRNTKVDPAGRILQSDLQCLTINLGNPCGGSNQVPVTTNAYTRFGMLVRQRSTADASAPADSMGYDESGNMVFWRKAVGGPVHSYKIDAAHNWLRKDSTSLETVQFDSTSNGARDYEHPTVTGCAERYFFYDGLQRMTGSEHYDNCTPQATWVEAPTSCGFDPDGELARPCEPGAPWLAFDGANPAAALLLGTGSPGWHFVHGPGVDDPLVGFMRGTGSTTRLLYWVTDGQGRQFVVADSAGAHTSDDDDATARRYHKYAGGTQRGSSFGADRFASGDAAQVSFFRNRAYDQNTGRWLQEDPIGMAGGLNLYQFNGNNPVAYTDPFGLCPTCLPALIAGVAVGGIRLGANLLSGRPAFENVGHDGILAGAAVLTLGAVVPAIALATTATAGTAAAGDVAGAAKLTIQFGRVANQVSHTFRHTDAAGLNRAQVQAAVEEHLAGAASQIAPGSPLNQIIEVAGQRIQYTAYQVSEGVVNVGRIHPVE